MSNICGSSGRNEDVNLGRSEESDVNSPRHCLNTTTEKELQLAQLENAFAELYHLLEQYAPVWYTQEQHDKARWALGSLKRLNEATTNNR
jgi:hypothetical protein